MAARRKGPRRRHSSDYDSNTMATAASAALLTFTLLIFTLCLSAFNFDLDGESTTHPRLEACRLACDARLQSAALESHVPPAAAPPAADALFHFRDGRAADRPRDGGDGRAGQQPPPARPRRLPALIKVLTGFGDAPDPAPESDGRRPIVARAERPDFLPRRRPSDGGGGPPSHDETVQIAAAAAAAAVFSRSARLFGHHRMHRVNSEWDAALRWIAGWDRPRGPGSAPPGVAGGAEPPRASEGSSNGAAGDREGYDSFVDDLARMLESCIGQCVEDEQFEAQLGSEGAGGAVAGGSSAGDLAFRSIFGWMGSSSFPRISLGKLGVISSESIFVLGRTIQFLASSLVLYAIHSLWILASPALSEWYSSLGYNESPEWLLEHEKELQKATKASRLRQKKKSRRKQSVKKAGQSKMAPSNDVTQKERRVDNIRPVEDGVVPDSSASHIESATYSVKDDGKPSVSADTLAKKRDQTSAPDGGVLHSTAEIAVLDSKDSVSGSQDSSEGIPSVISCLSTSASSSPSFKPIGHPVDQGIPFGQPLQGPPRPVLGLDPLLGRHSPSQLGRQSPFLLGRQSPLFSPLAPPNGPVPTQEQRNEAARQLREFQNAQIQRILLRRKLSRLSDGSDGGRPSASSPAGHGLVAGGSLRSTGTAPAASVEQIKALRPPPGLTHPSTELPSNVFLPNQDDKAFLTENEIFLSKLLDDDDEDDEVEVPSTVQIGIECMSPEPSLDPSAAPFVCSGKVGSARQEKCPFPKSKEEKGDVWLSNPNELLKGNSPGRIKGVYGGSVW